MATPVEWEHVQAGRPVCGVCGKLCNQSGGCGYVELRPAVGRSVLYPAHDQCSHRLGGWLGCGVHGVELPPESPLAGRRKRK